jgi:hypothetical protein
MCTSIKVLVKVLDALIGERAVKVILALWLLPLGVMGCNTSPQERAVAEIKNRHGEVTVDEKAPGRPVVKVSFRDSLFKRHCLNDTDLAALEPHLQALSDLRELDLVRTCITDQGLKHLRGLTRLKTLELGSALVGGSELTNAGVEELRKALPQTQIYFYQPQLPQPLPLPGDLHRLGKAGEGQ